MNLAFGPRQVLDWLVRHFAVPVLAVLLALVVGAVVMALAALLTPGQKFDPFLWQKAYGALWDGALGSDSARINTMVFTAPLLLAGLGVGLGFKGGLFNIGAQGQFLMGALAAVAVGGALATGSPYVAVPLALIAGMAAGALMGFIPGYLKATSGAHEVVTTIMLNYVALSVLSWAVSGPLRLPRSPQPATAGVGNAALPIIFGRNGHLGIMLALLAVPLIWFLLQRTTRGFEIRAVGANPDAARYAGIRPKVLTVLTMSMAGLLGGAAGAVNMLGINHSMTGSFSTTVGFDSITVALLGRSNPVGILFAALLLGIMRAGSGAMQIQARVPAQMVDVVQGVILLFLVAGFAIQRIYVPRRRRGERVVEAPTVTASYREGAI